MVREEEDGRRERKIEKERKSLLSASKPKRKELCKQVRTTAGSFSLRSSSFMYTAV